MDVKRDKDNEQHDEENQPRGEEKKAQPVSLKKSEATKGKNQEELTEGRNQSKKKSSLKQSMKTNMRGKVYVRRLISDNIKETTYEFIYKVNFQAGKGQND